MFFSTVLRVWWRYGGAADLNKNAEFDEEMGEENEPHPFSCTV